MKRKPTETEITDIALTWRAASKLLRISASDLAWLEETSRLVPVDDGRKYMLGEVVGAAIAYIKEGYVIRLRPGTPEGPLARRVITNAVAARLLQISAGRVSQLARDGWIAVDDGGYHLGAVITGYLEFLLHRDWLHGYSLTGRDLGGR
jgi:hypothetical protein